MNTPIIYEALGKVGLIRLHRPSVMNALNDELMEALGQTLDDCENNENIKCVIITGSDKVFAAGADISMMQGMSYSHAYQSNFITRNWERLKTFRKPVIAAVSGVAFGGGCELALMCDIVYASETARFALPEVKVGVIPGAGGTQRLPRAIGKSKAMELCLTGRSMDAHEAERNGLVARVFPVDTLLDETLATANTIASYSLPILMMMKESINRAYESSLNEGLLFERRTLHATFGLHDNHEGMQAFLEKRPPVFKGA